ncbi:MAG: RtcB family protein [Deltaproteobacteria bacterium]|nr:RtcB family protein [Deltaproteobacteria bacterium]
MGKNRPRLERLDEFRWLLPRQGEMRAEGLVYASAGLLAETEGPGGGSAVEQVANVAHLPGLVGRALAMPDIHFGYGFPIGGVAAFDPADGGVVSPGGVGYDINCGVRLLATELAEEDVRPRLAKLLEQLFRAVPSGVGSEGLADLPLDRERLDRVLADGARWVVEQGFGEEEDLEAIESRGRIAGADPAAVSERARSRGLPQLGSLGSGNHFIEVGRVAEVRDAEAAEAFGLRAGRIVVSIHTGSRGLGHQVCDDAVRELGRAATKYRIRLPDRQLCCAPLGTPEAERYLAAMAAAANFAFANRQAIAHRVRQVFERLFGGRGSAAKPRTVYDVAHNIAKWEEHLVRGVSRRLCVHRKGATRAFPAGHPELPLRYRRVGQPVLIPGDMGRASWVLVGLPRAMEETFGSSCHGAGRLLSREQAKRRAHGRNIVEELGRRGILLRAASRGTVVEELPEAYKDVDEVVGVVTGAGLCGAVARLEPLAVIKG